jgi:hypothetical protein
MSAKLRSWLDHGDLPNICEVRSEIADGKTPQIAEFRAGSLRWIHTRKIARVNPVDFIVSSSTFGLRRLRCALSCCRILFQREALHGALEGEAVAH